MEVVRKALLTTTEAAMVLGMGRQTVVRLIKAGELPGRKVGGRWYVPRLELRDWLRGEK